jgi:RecA/RadA recombinase
MRFPVAMINDVGKIMSLFIEDYKKNYMDMSPQDRPKFMFIIDSLGMLLTDTDVDQFNKGDMKGDMGRKPKQLNALVRNIINKIADCNIGVVCTNHTYASQDMFNPDDKVSGGEGIIYGSSIVVASKKFKLKEDEDGNKTTDVLGIRSTFAVMKTRYGRPFEKANLNIRFDSGLDEYSGLLDYFERIGVVQKEGNKLKYVSKDGTEYKEFRKNFGNDILQKIIDEWDYEKYKLISSKTDISESLEEEFDSQQPDSED